MAPSKEWMRSEEVLSRGKGCWSQERERPGCWMALLHWCREDTGAVKGNLVLKFSMIEAGWLGRKVDMRGLKWQFSERPACNVDLWLTSENLDFRRFPSFPAVMNDSQQWNVPKLCERCGLCWTPDFLLGNTSLVNETSHVITARFWRNGVCSVTLLGEDSWILVPGLFCTSPHASCFCFCFCCFSSWFCSVFFCLQNHTYKCKYSLPLSPSESSNQKVNGLKSGDTLNKIRSRKGESKNASYHCSHLALRYVVVGRK